ncbi:hypothetical protein F4802DRAFT_601023 [Xylaria palmicola]|nr:hypothetical protein F4802DRAFT_601023 [Xylaria palmicola]
MVSALAVTVGMNRDVEPLLPSPIQGLSVELLRDILEYLPDVSSLYHAILSCSLFYRILLGAERAISTRVLLNQVDFDVLPEAMMASEFGLLFPRDKDLQSREVVFDFVAQHLEHRQIPPGILSLRRALHISRLHFYVDALAKRFAVAALVKSPLNRSNHPPTREETWRIERGLYRFETYCNLFRERGRLLLFESYIRRECKEKLPPPKVTVNNDRKVLFFDKFSPWEHEQLGCIHDFLVRSIVPSFTEVAEHDVRWGAANVDYVDIIDNRYLHDVISRGLATIYDVSTAEIYEEQYRALNAAKTPWPGDFLYDGLEEDTKGQYRGVFVADITPENEDIYIKRPFFNDPDPGPKNAWRWAHIEENQLMWVYREDREELREWGYVMWDQSRLDASSIFQGPWEDILSERDLVLEDQEAGRERGYMQNSWEQREAASRAGASGWWSWGDRSKLIYKNRDRYGDIRDEWASLRQPGPNNRYPVPKPKLLQE